MKDASKSIITLTTDFGTNDPFVGIMKGVILGINPSANIVDICHAVEPGNIEHSTFILNSALKYFPMDTIHVVVVDPGVGSDRRGILVRSGAFFVVAPDNGAITLPVKNHGCELTIELLNPEYFIHPVSSTFHGRDIFAPVAAHLSLGKAPWTFGQALDGPLLLKLPQPASINHGKIKGVLIYHDSFGNMATNLGLPVGEDISGWKLTNHEGRDIPLYDHYAAARDGVPSALINSTGNIEIFIKNGNCAELLGFNKGETVFLVKKE